MAGPAGRDWRATVATIGTIVSLLLVGAGLFYTNEATRNQQKLALQGQVADRFTAAIGQLGQEDQEDDDKLSIRLGGIYALQRLMRDSPDDEAAVVQVLCAFVRTHAPPPRETAATPSSSADVRAAVTVLAYRPQPQQFGLDFSGAQLVLDRADLSGGNLSGADLRAARLSGADLSDADLSGADLRDASLANADLSGTQVTGTVLSGANLSGAKLGGARLTRAILSGADLRDANLARTSLAGADLSAARLTGAYLGGADLSDAELADADLSGADLSGADLSRANLAGARGWTAQQLAKAQWDRSTRLPAGLTFQDLDPAFVEPDDDP